MLYPPSPPACPLHPSVSEIPDTQCRRASARSDRRRGAQRGREAFCLRKTLPRVSRGAQRGASRAAGPSAARIPSCPQEDARAPDGRRRTEAAPGRPARSNAPLRRVNASALAPLAARAALGERRCQRNPAVPLASLAGTYKDISKECDRRHLIPRQRVEERAGKEGRAMNSARGGGQPSRAASAGDTRHPSPSGSADGRPGTRRVRAPRLLPFPGAPRCDSSGGHQRDSCRASRGMPGLTHEHAQNRRSNRRSS